MGCNYSLYTYRNTLQIGLTLFFNKRTNLKYQLIYFGKNHGLCLRYICLKVAPLCSRYDPHPNFHSTLPGRPSLFLVRPKNPCSCQNMLVAPFCSMCDHRLTAPLNTSWPPFFVLGATTNPQLLPSLNKCPYLGVTIDSRPLSTPHGRSSLF